jgi:hypothetical protein
MLAAMRLACEWLGALCRFGQLGKQMTFVIL